MPWNGGYKGPDAGLTNVQFLGSEPGGWLRYLVDTGLNVDVRAGVKGIYAARIFIGQIGAQGSGVPGPGSYMCAQLRHRPAGAPTWHVAPLCHGAPAADQGARHHHVGRGHHLLLASLSGHLNDPERVQMRG